MTTENLSTTCRTTSEISSTTTPPVNSEVLVARCMGNVAFAFVLLEELEVSGRQQVDAIVLHTTGNKPCDAAEAAHSLKGAAAIIGAEPLREKAAEIEKAGRAGETPHLMEMVRELQREFERCLNYIPILRTDLQRRSVPAT